MNTRFSGSEEEDQVKLTRGGGNKGNGSEKDAWKGSRGIINQFLTSKGLIISRFLYSIFHNQKKRISDGFFFYFEFKWWFSFFLKLFLCCLDCRY